jgi:hypothetical protein
VFVRARRLLLKVRILWAIINALMCYGVLMTWFFLWTNHGEASFSDNPVLSISKAVVLSCIFGVVVGFIMVPSMRLFRRT